VQSDFGAVMHGFCRLRGQMPLTEFQSLPRAHAKVPGPAGRLQRSPLERPAPAPGRPAAAWLVLIVGALLSFTAAVGWRAQAQGQVQRSFDAEAAAVGSTVTTSLLRMDDLTVQARALISSDSNLTNRGLANWYASLGGGGRYAGILSFGYVEFVPVARLQAFRAQQRRDPIPGAPNTAGPLALGSGPRNGLYCLARLGLAGELNQFVTDPSFDYCSIPGFTGLPDARDSGRFVAFTLGGRNIAVFAPVYRGGIVPPTLAQRRARALGVVAELFDIKRILGRAIAGHGHLQISVIRPGANASATSQVPGVPQQVTARVGDVTSASSGARGRPALQRRFTVEADGRWIVTVSGSSGGIGVTPMQQGVIILAGGLILSVLAALLVGTLSTGRARALRTVEERTEQLRHMALHDALTGLPNRQLMSERAERMLERGRSENLQVAAMYMDIDGFKGVNDSFGHPAGDELLRATAGRIVATLRTGDTVGRIGGDEFIVLAAGRAEGEPERLAQRLLEALREPLVLGGPEGVILSITASIGVAVGDRVDAEDLMRDADIALYGAKSAGKNRYLVFDPEMRVALQDRVSLENDMRRALRQDELTLLYQPTFELDGELLSGIEALLRWEHPSRGTLEPSQFISIAEESGLIVDLGAWVINHGCAQAARWRAEGFDLELSVNVSARQLDDPGLISRVRDGLLGSGLPVDSLTLEMTETALMRDPDLTAARLQELKRLGVRIAIDDFGTGYSSLAYLRQFPVDTLKIDRTFVSGIARSPQARALIRTVVALASSLGIDTVAEGIEDERQRHSLLREGCRAGQGYLFGRPMDAAEMRGFLESHRAAGGRTRRAGAVG
jgi:diguanylate cyclase (GGDEF)-like protein